MEKKKEPAVCISPTRKEDYASWYQKVVRAADMAELSGVRGCMVLKAWGYGSWELMQRELDARFKATGHENYYFPLFIPLSYFQREAEHVDGFAKEMAVVTHHRLTKKEGRLVPDGVLEEPLVVRPTSETIIGESMAKWIHSYRDLPLLINQWANVVRWEMRPRILLRTTEFLWQEGHTAHETREDALQETHKMLGIYKDFAENVLALPVIAGEKIPSERFPGAENTFCIEAMMQDGRALQAATSHYLGQNFAKACCIQFQQRDGFLGSVHTTSWGASTRLLGAIVMAHADDHGMRMPPRVAQQQIVIIPIIRENQSKEAILSYCTSLQQELASQNYATQPIRAKVDMRDISGADKKWEWIKKGAPILLEVGKREIEEQSLCVTRRDQLMSTKTALSRQTFIANAVNLLADFQKTLFDNALALRTAKTIFNMKTFEELSAYFSKGADDSFVSGQGFVRAKWCGDEETLKLLEPLGVTVRVVPFDQDEREGTCILTGKPATQEVVFARAY